MQTQARQMLASRVPTAFYNDVLTLAVEIEYLKAEMANMRMKSDKERRTKRRDKKRKR